MSGDRREAVEAAIQAHMSGLVAALFSDPGGAVVTEAQTEAVSSYAARQHLALLDRIEVVEAERDALAGWKAVMLPVLAAAVADCSCPTNAALRAAFDPTSIGNDTEETTK